MSGAGGAAGTQAWAALGELVRRPFRRADQTEPVPALRELEALEGSPRDPDRAQALAEVLQHRAAHDPDFARSLTAWLEEAKAVSTGSGDVHNTVSGGSQGNVLQVRDLYGSVTFGTPPAPDAGPAGQTG
ncbi:hypothetical protein ABZ690_00105 [Streptomyces sp. NPDC006967]|uniref:hypothetical protein n=1 Tax=unclassified Streptomyces TaxID=2593676 RepID=UPI0027E5674E|nr:hypothetical protein [Streptomyces sp. SM1]